MARVSVALLDLLSNTLVLHHVAPYLSCHSILSLAATSKVFHQLIRGSPVVFRYLDLSNVQGAVHGPLVLSSGCEDGIREECDSEPLRLLLRPTDALFQRVQTLVLDGISLPADMVRQIISRDSYNVRILSIRDVKGLDEPDLIRVLKCAAKLDPPHREIKLRGLYIFGPRDDPSNTNGSGSQHARSEGSWSPTIGVTSSLGAQLGGEAKVDGWVRPAQAQDRSSPSIAPSTDGWYRASGMMARRTVHPDWALALMACEGAMAFDAVLCRGPRHRPSNDAKAPLPLSPAMAMIALGPHGCQRCRSCPEGPARFGMSSASHQPLLSPPPTHSSSLRAAQYPPVDGAGAPLPFFARCAACLVGRWCERCYKWWCEDCYDASLAQNRTRRQSIEEERLARSGKPAGDGVNVHLGLCVEHCLVGVLMSGAGSGGMWG